MYLCTGVTKGYLLIVFSPFGMIETPSKLKIKTNIHVNVCISENIAITVLLSSLLVLSAT